MGQALFMVKVSESALPPVPIDIGNATEFYRRATTSIGALNGEGMVEAGRVQLTARLVAPSGWLICDGAEVARASFPALFAAIGTAYGAGNGSTTFNLPTQAQCVPPAVAPSPPQVVTGGSVDPATGTPPPADPANPTGGSGGGSVTGGRPAGFHPAFRPRALE